MRLILIPVVAMILTLLPPTVIYATGSNEQHPVPTEDTEKRDEEQSPGDEEPECE